MVKTREVDGGLWIDGRKQFGRRGGLAAAQQALSEPLFSIPMVSGSAWNVGTGDLILFLSLILITYVPAITTWLPDALK